MHASSGNGAPGLNSPTGMRPQTRRPLTGLLSEAAQALARSPGGNSLSRTALPQCPPAARRRSSWPCCVGNIPTTPSSQLWPVDLFACPESCETSALPPRCGAAAEADRQVDRGPAYATRRENFKAQWYEAQLDRGDDANGCPKEAPAGNADAFQECASAVDSMIEDLTRAGRQKPAWLQEEEEAECREERLREQEELRMMRKQQREARDPRRKVQAKLDRKRQSDAFWSEKSTEIPMQKVNASLKGGKVSLVDVHSLRARCHESSAVRSLLQQHRVESQRRRLMAAGKSALHASASSPALTQGR